MLSREEKIKNFDNFLRSKKFGIDTLMTIYLFRNNTQYILSTLKLYQSLITQSDDGYISNNISQMDKVVVKQFILLDVIMKLEILIESTLILIHSLSKDYSSIPKFMVYYDMNLIRTVIHKIENREYNMEKILGLMNISRLPLLTKEEKKFLVNDYSNMANKMYSKLDILVEFYERFRLIYGKTKHGLTINPGQNLSSDPNYYKQSRHNPEFENSLLIGHDIKRETDLPNGFLIGSNKGSTNEGEFFNTMTFVKFNKKLTEQLQAISSILEEIVPYVCDNHMTCAKNCGESYLPYFHDKKNDKIGLIFSNAKSTEEEVIKIKSEIMKKIIPIMNIKDVDLTTITSINQPAIINSLNSNIVTNVWKPFNKNKSNASKSLFSVLKSKIKRQFTSNSTSMATT
jgi:hypothetical protein